MTYDHAAIARALRKTWLDTVTGAAPTDAVFAVLGSAALAEIERQRAEAAEASVAELGAALRDLRDGSLSLMTSGSLLERVDAALRGTKP